MAMKLVHLLAALLTALAVFTISSVYKQRKKRGGYPLPPSPPSDPLIGHFRQIPQDHPEHQFIRWGKEYSEDTFEVRNA